MAINKIGIIGAGQMGSGIAQVCATSGLAVRIQDIQDACDLLHTTYERTGHVDGRVSLEVLPELANNTAGTIAQAQEYWQRVNRPNLYVKIPATAEGVPAIEESIYRGLCINVTLLGQDFPRRSRR